MAPPTVISNGYSPADGATNVAVGANLSLTFNEAVQKGTTGNFVLGSGSGRDDRVISVTSSQVTIGGTGANLNRIVTINPTNDLNPNETYIVQIASTAIKDSSNNFYGGILDNTTWNFATVVETTPPTVISNGYSPADDATNVAVDANLSLTFNEAVQKGATGNFVLGSGSGRDDRVISVTSAQVTIGGTGANLNRIVTINPTNDLNPNETYIVQISNTAIKDSSNNFYAGILDNTTWNFTTVDNVAPTVSTYSPANNASGVAVGANLVLTFNEAVQKGTGNITIRRTSDNADINISVTSNQVTIGGTGANLNRIVTINPTNDLNGGTAYHVRIPSGVIRDRAATPNDYAGISDATTWNFTTVNTAAGIARLAARVSGGSATLTISGHTGFWHYKHSAGACSTQVAAGTTTAEVTGLTANTAYTYKAYSDSGCSTELTNDATDAEFRTPPARLTARLSGGRATLTISGHTGSWYYQHSAGTCSTEVGLGTTTAEVTELTVNTAYTYKAYSDSSCSKELTTNATDAEFRTPPARLSASGASGGRATLTISGHTGSWYYQHSAGTCSTEVGLGTTTAVVTGLTANTAYTYKAYSDSGCTIELTTNATDADFRTRAAGLRVIDIHETRAQLRISGHTGAWYYKGNQSGASCEAETGGDSDVALENLTANTAYTYKAYSDSGCTMELTTDATDAEFRTTSGPFLGVGDFSDTTAILILLNHASDWYYKGSQNSATCVSVSGGTVEVNLEGLTPNTAYTYKAYSDSACTVQN